MPKPTDDHAPAVGSGARLRDATNQGNASAYIRRAVSGRSDNPPAPRDYVQRNSPTTKRTESSDDVHEQADRREAQD